MDPTLTAVKNILHRLMKELAEEQIKNSQILRECAETKTPTPKDYWVRERELERKVKILFETVRSLS